MKTICKKLYIWFIGIFKPNKMISKEWSDKLDIIIENLYIDIDTVFSKREDIKGYYRNNESDDPLIKIFNIGNVEYVMRARKFLSKYLVIVDTYKIINNPFPDGYDVINDLQFRLEVEINNDAFFKHRSVKYLIPGFGEKYCSLFIDWILKDEEESSESIANIQ